MKRNKLATGLVATSAVGAAVLAMSGPAHALATNYTPTSSNSGAAVTFTGTNVSFTDIPASQTLTCTTFNLTGTVTNNGVSRLMGAEAGSLGSLTSSGCTNPIAGATTVTPTGTWKVKITGDEVSGVSPATLYDVNADVTAAGCTFDVAGSVDGTFNETNQRFTPTAYATDPNIELEISSTPVGSTCLLLDVQLGDPIDVGGYWTTSGLTITNP